MENFGKMAEQQLYEETMLDIAPMLEEFPMDIYEGSPTGSETFEVLEQDLLTSTVQSLEDASLTQENVLSPQYGEFIDPDMFLNGVVKRESESDCSTSSQRNTPSPSDSNKSFESYPSSGYESCRNVHLNNILLDSPPISPENPVRSSQIVTMHGSNVIRVGTAQLPIVRKPACPSNLADLKKIKLPPKGVLNNSMSSGAISKSVTKKTIILNAKDYQALVKNMKNRTNNGTILIKATSAIGKSKPVLPKPPQPQLTATVTTVQERRAETSQQFLQSTTMSPMVPSVDRLVNERTMKRHQRMIKNRESAFLSRVRKKEYVTTLEQQIDALTKENQFLKSENSKLLSKLKLKCSCGTTLGTVNYFTKQITPNVRKNTAIVLAMLFMVSLNFGPLGNLFTGISETREIVESSAQSVHHKRNLLWLDDSSRFNPPRNIDISLNMSNLEELSKTAGEPFSTCPFYVNQTENIRLARDLRRWIGENGYKNLTDRDGDDMRINSFSEMFALKDTIDSMYQQMKDISSQMETFQKRSKLGTAKKRHPTKGAKVKESESLQQRKAIKESEIALYYPGLSKTYAKFFEEIGRRDDTFYLVSFSGEHLLLPALAYNKTNRPKMSLMLPALMENATNQSEKVTLMQIDCEVMNTSMIQIREKTIPGDLLRTQGKADDPFNKESSKRAAEFTDNNVRNISSSGTGKESRRYHKHQANRPFFVQRMSESMRNELDLN
ncbi:cyclic AMP-dependent transcription factor ATF-6 alpha [Topomyia yanbarensis]|uniref:cyclic AMP-dependent transcription factor ATF-6 alpha n=1 Tax=Topomyia yanbarensis TaxID=2498891 RepID=UPI00273C9AF0|nr:cyclic AMP-dependent transcription factor ATF-6 alpha [Topomyia yanbarensis]